jgi:hypothetical protein
MFDHRSVALLAIAWAFGAATPAAAQKPIATYVVLSGEGPVARAVMPAGSCPQITVNGGPPQGMEVRAEPDKPDGPFPILVCEFLVMTGDRKQATSASIDGDPLPLPKDTLKSIAVFGDTGCRLKADKSEALAAHDPDEADEIEEEGKFQNCDYTTDRYPKYWPFKPMSKIIADRAPDLVVHVGDYYYRESPCPSRDEGCAGSPYRDKWETWAADFFTPAKPLLRKAPWIVVRGNHENCERGGLGYALLLDPSLAKGKRPTCVDPADRILDQYTVSVGGHDFIVLDSSNAADECEEDECESKPYAEQFRAMQHPKAGTWLVTHKPIWGFTQSRKGKLKIRNMTLQAALKEWNGAPPKGIDLVLSGHIHLWEALSFSKKRPPQFPPQFVLGSGSTELARKITKNLDGRPIGGTTVRAATTDHRFGYTIFKPKSGGGWDATFYNHKGTKKIACEVDPTEVTCEKL